MEPFCATMRNNLHYDYVRDLRAERHGCQKQISGTLLYSIDNEYRFIHWHRSYRIMNR